MASFSKIILSGSTDGKAISVAATSSPGTTIHTGPTNVNEYHEVWLYAVNYSSSSQNLVVQWGGTAAADGQHYFITSGAGLNLLVPGLIIKGNGTPLVIKAYADVANNISVLGYVNKIA